MQTNKIKTNKEKAKNFGRQIVHKINELIREHNEKVRKLNNDIERQNKIHKVVVSKGDTKLQGQFFKYAEDTLEKIRIMNGKLGQTEKMKKQRRDSYCNKIGIIVGYMNDLLENNDIKVFIDQNIIKWVKQLGQYADQTIKSLALLEKQSKGFCFGGSNNTEHHVEKGLINIISYCQVWQFMQKASPQIQRETQHRYIDLDYNESIFFDIDKMIVNTWPEPQIIEIQVQKIKEIIVQVQKQKHVPQKISGQMSFKQQIQKKQLFQRYQKLQREINVQKMIREAHEMLIGLGRSQNVGKAIQTYKSVPEMNQSEAKQSMKSQTELKINPAICNILGCLYEEGKFMVRDLKKAVEYYIKSASAEDSEGMYKIGKFLQKKLVNSKELFEQEYANRNEEIKDAIEYYQKSAEKGHLDAITDLGHIYENGIKMDQVRDENSVVSNSQVSHSSHNSFIIEPNLEYAIKYYQLAKKEEFPRALNNLGALYVRMANEIPQTMKGSNLERGIKYLKRASELQYPKAFLNLGKCFQGGLGVKVNVEKAKALYMEGSQLGDNQCKLQLVKCLLNNQIKMQEKSDLKMVQYLRQIIISDPNIAESQYLMGIFYQKGIALQANPENAFYHVNKAAKLEYPPAIIKIGDYYYSGYYVEKDYVKAKTYYEKASFKGLSQGLINIGLMYEKGLIQTQNKNQQTKKAQNCLLQAAKMGNSNAFIFLNKEEKKDNKVIKEAAQLGSEEALKLLAKTNSTAQLQAKTVTKSKAEFGALLNRFVKELNSRPKDHQMIRNKKSPPPLSQKMKEMMIFSPRSRVDIPSQMQSIRFNSPQSFRSHPYISRQSRH